MALPTKLMKERSEYLNRAGLNDFNDCSVKALAIVCGVSYGEAYEALRKKGRKTNRGVTFWEIEYAARTLGFKLKEINSWKGKTTKTLDLPRTGRYLVGTADHALAVQFGLVKDYSAGKNMRIREVYLVEAS